MPGALADAGLHRAAPGDGIEQPLRGDPHPGGEARHERQVVAAPEQPCRQAGQPDAGQPPPRRDALQAKRARPWTCDRTARRGGLQAPRQRSRPAPAPFAHGELRRRRRASSPRSQAPRRAGSARRRPATRRRLAPRRAASGRSGAGRARSAGRAWRRAATVRCRWWQPRYGCRSARRRWSGSRCRSPRGCRSRAGPRCRASRRSCGCFSSREARQLAEQPVGELDDEDADLASADVGVEDERPLDQLHHLGRGLDAREAAADHGERQQLLLALRIPVRSACSSVSMTALRSGQRVASVFIVSACSAMPGMRATSTIDPSASTRWSSPTSVDRRCQSLDDGDQLPLDVDGVDLRRAPVRRAADAAAARSRRAPDARRRPPRATAAGT